MASVFIGGHRALCPHTAPLHILTQFLHTASLPLEAGRDERELVAARGALGNTRMNLTGRILEMTKTAVEVAANAVALPATVVHSGHESASCAGSMLSLQCRHLGAAWVMVMVAQ